MAADSMLVDNSSRSAAGIQRVLMGEQHGILVCCHFHARMPSHGHNQTKGTIFDGQLGLNVDWATYHWLTADAGLCRA